MDEPLGVQLHRALGVAHVRAKLERLAVLQGELADARQLLAQQTKIVEHAGREWSALTREVLADLEQLDVVARGNVGWEGRTLAFLVALVSRREGE